MLFYDIDDFICRILRPRRQKMKRDGGEVGGRKEDERLP